jgi:hypothetical protein
VEEIVGAYVRRVPDRELGHKRVDIGDTYLGRAKAQKAAA